MSVCLNYFLCYKNITANRTLFALSQACFRTSFRNGGDYLFLVLGAKVSRAYITSIIGVFVSMSICSYRFLSCNNFVTNRAMLAFCESCFGTGRLYRFINCLGVRQFCYVLGYSRNLDIANGTIDNFIIASKSVALCGNLILPYSFGRSMNSELINLASFKLCVAKYTFLMLRALYLARSFDICNPFARSVVFLGDFLFFS